MQVERGESRGRRTSEESLEQMKKWTWPEVERCQVVGLSGDVVVWPGERVGSVETVQEGPVVGEGRVERSAVI